MKKRIFALATVLTIALSSMSAFAQGVKINEQLLNRGQYNNVIITDGEATYRYDPLAADPVAHPDNP